LGFKSRVTSSYGPKASAIWKGVAFAKSFRDWGRGPEMVTVTHL